MKVDSLTSPATRRKRRPARTPQSAAPRVQAFADTLRQRQKDAGARRKGERTRDRLKVATVLVLEERGYLRLRVTDICRRARVSPAAFYLYFRNKEEITIEVLTEFLKETFTLGRSPVRPHSLFDAIYEANLKWASAVRANAGLMRCLLQLGDQVPEFRRLGERLNHEWFAYVTQRLMRRFPAARLDERAVLLAVYALGGMMDELSRKVLVARDEHLEPVVDAIAPSDEALAEFLSVLWYRALFGAEPARVHHPASRALLALGRMDPTHDDPQGAS
jgi:AcrR family transcriptional regulator